jgi:energy-coupling factor transport system permease protein
VIERRPHSVALIVAIAIPALVVVWSVDPWTPIFMGLPLLAFLTAMTSGVVQRPSTTALTVLSVTVVTATLASLLYAVPRGTIFFDWGWMTISQGSIDVAIAAMFRILVIALPAMLVGRAISAHEFLATCAVRRVLPDRVALAALIALRLVPVIASDLDETRQARRANGRTASPFAVALTSLVIAIRRAVRMSDVAEVRGFSRPDRVWSAYRRLRMSDWVLIVGSASIGIAAMSVVVYLGLWNSAIR